MLGIDDVASAEPSRPTTFMECYFIDRGFTHAADFDLDGYCVWREQKLAAYRKLIGLPVDQSLTDGQMNGFRAWVFKKAREKGE